MSAAYEYENDLLTKILTPTTTYNFEYGNFGLRSKVKIGENRTLAEYSYTDQNNYLSSIDYGNGGRVEYKYDQKGRLTKQTYDGGDTVTYTYDNSGALAKVYDSATGITTTNYYDFTDRLMKYVESGSGFNHSVGYEYDDKNNLTKLVETINGTAHTTEYAYDDDNRVTSVTADGTTVTYSYDAFGRVTQQVTKNGDTVVTTETFTYVNPTANTTSSQIATHTVVTAGKTYSYAYTYDDNGNITRIVNGANGNVTEYYYDSANQLIRENDPDDVYTNVWTYDNAGNIQSRAKYEFTTGDLDGETASETVNYAYGDPKWGDLLTRYNGHNVYYDDIGNIECYRNWSYTWEHGRELASLSDGTTNWSFEYDANGMRTKRTSGADTYTYVYNGSQLTRMTKGSTALDFTYDANGKPLTVTYNGTTYYYITNIQGDVVAIVDGNGVQVAVYMYDAWGRHTYTTGQSGNALYQLNPLRYRGYVYDTETGLYYVSSRYYDPEIGRWINADNRISGVGGDVLGYNMFAYCMNNPVNMSDPSGGWPKWLETAVKVASVVVAVTAVVVMVATVSAVSLGTAAPGALLGASVFLGAALSGINGGVANEAKGNSYINGYLGGATGGAIQAACSKTPAGTILGGGAGVTVGTVVTDVMNNLDPDSANSTAKEIKSNAITSGGKALVTSSLTAYMCYASDLAAINGANGLMPTYTRGFGEAVKAFFGWLDDALVYIWE